MIQLSGGADRYLKMTGMRVVNECGLSTLSTRAGAVPLAPAGSFHHFVVLVTGALPMADFTKEWIEHLKTQISGRMTVVADKMDPQAYDELVTDLAWFAFRFARDPDTKMRKVFR